MNPRPSGYEPDELPLLHPAMLIRITKLSLSYLYRFVNIIILAHILEYPKNFTSRNKQHPPALDRYELQEQARSDW